MKKGKDILVFSIYSGICCCYIFFFFLFFLSDKIHIVAEKRNLSHHSN